MRKLVVVFCAVVCGAAVQVTALTVKGRVVTGESGKPATGITVLVEHHENRNSDNPDDFQKRVPADADGRFELNLPEGGKQYMFLVLDAEDRIIDGHTHVSKDKDLGTVTQQLSCVLSGKVVDTGGEPITGATVRVEWRLRPHRCSHFVDATRVTTDAEGCFGVGNMSVGEYRVTALTDDYAPVSSRVKVSEGFVYQELHLERGCSVTGVVSDSSGPVAGVEVAVGRNRKAVSDGRGRYALSALPEGKHGVRVVSDKYALSFADRVEVKCAPGRSVALDLSVSRTGTLELGMLKETDEVVLPARVRLRFRVAASDGGGRSRRSRRSTYRNAGVSNGVALFEGLPPGNYEIALSGDGIAEVEDAVSIESMATCSRTVTVARTFVLEGVVRSASGAPVPEAQVHGRIVEKEEDADGGAAGVAITRRLGGRQVAYDRTEKDGGFKLRRLPEGELVVSVRHDDWQPVATNVVVPAACSSSLVIVVREGLSIEGMVLESDGTPVQGMKVYVSGPRSTDHRVHIENRIHKDLELDTNGLFRISGLVTGRYDVSVRHATTHETESHMPSVLAGTKELILTLARQVAVKGRALDGTGNPVAGATVTSRKGVDGRHFHHYSGSRDDDNQLKTDADGGFELKLREGGNYAVRVEKPPLLPAVTNVNVFLGGEAPGMVELVLADGHSVSGVVVRAESDETVSGLTVKASVAAGGGLALFYYRSQRYGKETRTDKEGRFTLEGLAPGVTGISVFDEDDDDLLLGSRKVHISGSRVRPLRIELEPLGTVKGVVYGNGGEPEAGVHIGLHSPSRPGGRSQSEETGPSGGFEFVNLTPGTYMLMVDERGDHSSSRQMTNVVVASGQTVHVRFGGEGDGVRRKCRGVISRMGDPLGPGSLRSTVGMPYMEWGGTQCPGRQQRRFRRRGHLCRSAWIQVSQLRSHRRCGRHALVQRCRAVWATGDQSVHRNRRHGVERHDRVCRRQRGRERARRDRSENGGGRREGLVHTLGHDGQGREICHRRGTSRGLRSPGPRGRRRPDGRAGERWRAAGRARLHPGRRSCVDGQRADRRQAGAASGNRGSYGGRSADGRVGHD